ncbi:MAG: ankyrin repeat domain-containing protein, partial [Gammaproteobacteria bacterium]|nr:ankyrin repeat domain-containing protein [Gammaproteobacteria bacterium]
MMSALHRVVRSSNDALNPAARCALHYAARAGFEDVMKLLLDNGADVDAPDAEGETPLASVLRSTSKRRDKLAVAAERLIQSGA